MSTERKRDATRSLQKSTFSSATVLEGGTTHLDETEDLRSTRGRCAPWKASEILDQRPDRVTWQNALAANFGLTRARLFAT